MRLLKDEFVGTGEVKGYKYRQFAIGQHAFLYEVLRDGEVCHFEVFKRKIAAPHPKSEIQEPKERYPNSKAFGVWAWTCMDIVSATRRFNEINTPPGKQII